MCKPRGGRTMSVVDGPAGTDRLKGCMCERCRYEAGLISLSPTVRSCLMLLILALFGLALRYLLPLKGLH